MATVHVKERILKGRESFVVRLTDAELAEKAAKADAMTIARALFAEFGGEKSRRSPDWVALRFLGFDRVQEIMDLYYGFWGKTTRAAVNDGVKPDCVHSDGKVRVFRDKSPVTETGRRRNYQHGVGR